MVHHNLWQTAVSTPVIGLNLLYEQQNTKDQRKKIKEKGQSLNVVFAETLPSPTNGAWVIR